MKEGKYCFFHNAFLLCFGIKREFEECDFWVIYFYFWRLFENNVMSFYWSHVSVNKFHLLFQNSSFYNLILGKYYFLMRNWRVVISQICFILVFIAGKLKQQEPYSCDHSSVLLHVDGMLWGQFWVMTSLYLDTTAERTLHSRPASC